MHKLLIYIICSEIMQIIVEYVSFKKYPTAVNELNKADRMDSRARSIYFK